MDGVSLVIAVLIGAGMGFSVAWYIKNKELSFEKQARKEMEVNRQQLSSEFKAIAGDVLRTHSKDFSERAESAEKGVVRLVENMNETLRNVETKIGAYEKASKEELGSLGAGIRKVLETGEKMQDTALSLKSVLSSASGVRGRWGEAVLKNILEESGMTEGVDYTLQTTIAGDDEAKLRPDVIINLPGGFRLAVDSKASLDAFFKAVEEKDEEKKKEHIAKFAQDLRLHVSKLSSKEYQSFLDKKIPYVVMFVPGEAAIRAAFEYDIDLYRDAQARKIMLASPATIIPLVLLIAHAWKQHKSIENAERIISEISVLGTRLKTFMGYVSSIGPALQAATKRFNSAASSWDSRVEPEIQRINEMGANLEEVSKMAQIEEEPRQPVKAGELKTLALEQ